MISGTSLAALRLALRQTARVTYRFGVLADSAEACAEGLALLARLAELGVDVQVSQRPARLSGDRWIARAVPMPKAPAVGEGPVER